MKEKKKRASKERSHGDDDGISNSAKNQSGKSNWNNGFSLSPLYMFVLISIIRTSTDRWVCVCTRFDVCVHRVGLCWSFGWRCEARAALLLLPSLFYRRTHSNRICNSFPWSFHHSVGRVLYSIQRSQCAALHFICFKHCTVNQIRFWLRVSLSRSNSAYFCLCCRHRLTFCRNVCVCVCEALRDTQRYVLLFASIKMQQLSKV